MAYSLTKTNGSTLINLADGVANGPDIDANAAVASVNLIGKNKASYGFYLNENFIKLLENFAYSTAPVSPTTGQIWWDTANAVLKVYNGTAWKEIAHSAPGSTSPSNAIAGDLWWNTTASTLNVYSGTAWIAIGPAIPPGSAVTQFVNNQLTDPLSAIHNVGNIVVNNKLAAVVSTESTSFTLSTPILGQTTIAPGFTIANNITVGGSIYGANLSISGTATLNGSPIATTSSGGTASFAAINSTPIGNAVPSTGAFTTLTSGSFNGIVGNATPSTAAFTTATVGGLQAVAIGNVTPGTAAFTTATAGGLQAVAIGNITPGTAAFTTVTTAGNVTPTANLTYNLGSTTAWWNNIYGTAIHAQYADLAERFAADQPMTAGTVVALGGSAEITAVDQELSESVFGVISTRAAYLMNSGAGSNETHPPVAVQGRVPVQVTGIVRKGDRLVSAGNGRARAGTRNEITAWNVIGRALQDKTDTGLGMIEAVVKLNS
jgi:hypothetical protein